MPEPVSMVTDYPKKHYNSVTQGRTGVLPAIALFPRKCDWVGTVGRDYRTNPTNPSPKGGLCYALEEF